MAIATSQTDIEDLLLRALTADETSRVTRLIERAERLLEANLPGLSFTAGSETLTVDPDGDDIITLPQYPVTGVSSVTVAGRQLAVDEFTFTTLGQLRRRAPTLDNVHLDTYGALTRWPDRGTIVVVTYDYGFGSASAVPGAIRDVAAELVVRRIQNPGQVSQESLGDRSISFAGTGLDSGHLDAGQMRRLTSWRRRHLGSMRIRT